jgi:peroxiredoxin Q/BCP
LLSWLFSDPLPVGAPAPDFSLPDDAGNVVRLRDLRGRNVVLVWYPGDDTPTCRQQLCEFRDNWEAAQEKDVVVLGVNPQNPGSHTRFREKFQFPFPLLVDAGQQVGELYHTRGILAKRTVYLIDRQGVIRYARRGKPSPQEVLAAAA